MIALTPAPATSSGNTASPAVSPASATPASPFDAILTLEALAATCAALDTAPLGGGALEGGGLEGLDDTSGTDTDDADDDEQGGALAYLVNLLNIAAPATPDAAGGASAGDGADAVIEGSVGGQDRQGSADPATGALPLPGTDDGRSTTDAAGAGKVLLADVAAAATKGDTGTQDLQATQDPTANMARAAEMFSQAPRHAVAVRDHIATPVQSPRWADDLGARVAMMVRGAESTASLQLTPIDLGPVEVSVTVRDSQATIHFGAAQAETRALLEASIPRLREMLAAQGFNLMDASVSQGFSRQARPDVPGISRGNGSEPEPEVREAGRVSALGLLDTYA
jgi:flagellar hook-length control protein FliK